MITTTTLFRFFAVWPLVALLVVDSVRARASTGGPRHGGVIRLSYPTDWRSLDPAIAFDSEAVPLMRLLFRGLLDFDSGIEIVPDQASDWSVSPDGKTYTFHLRQGIRFAHGREVEADDYIFSFERILNPATGSAGQTYLMDILGAEEYNAGKASKVTGLHAPDSRTLIIELKQPRFTFRYVLAMCFTAVVPRDWVEKYGRDFQYHLSGSGPYTVAEWKRNIRWKLARNPYYSGPDGLVDGFEIAIGADPALAAMMLERGEIDRMMAGPAEAARFRRDPKLRQWIQPVDTANTDYLYFNTEMKPFDDPRVRQAAKHAINRARLIKLAGGFGAPAKGIVPPAMPWSNPGLRLYDYDPAKARELLREAGYPNGFATELWYEINRTIDVRICAGIQQDLAEVGIRADLRPATVAAFEVKVRSRRQVPCGYWGWMEDYPDPSDFLEVLLDGGRITDADCNNVAFYNNPEVNRRLAEAGSSQDAAARQRLFREAEALVVHDAPWAPVLHEQVPILNHPRLHGTGTHPVWLWRYEKMWVDP